MFDKKINEIVDIFSNKFDAKADDIVTEVHRMSDYTRSVVDEWSDELRSMSKQAKIGLAVALGLGAIDTALLIAILVKLGR